MQDSVMRQEQVRWGERRLKRLLGTLGNRRMFVILTITPALIVLFMLTIYPFLANIWYSLLSYDLTRPGVRPFVGLRNYIEVLINPDFLAALQRTVYYIVLAVGIELILGLLIALLLVQNLHGQKFFRALLVIPLAGTPVAVGLIWRLMYNPTGGLANHLLNAVGLHSSQWTSSARGVIPSLVLVDVWQWTPFVVLILMAGLLALPEEPYEAARIDGASGLQTIWHLTIPMLSPTIFVAVLFRFIDSLKAFDIIWAMTGGGPGHGSTTLNIYTFKVAFQFLHMGTAATLAILMLILAIFVSTALLRYSKRRS
jgi:multiple sugar transport system permease protein